MDLPDEVIRDGREKLKQVFRYLQALQLRRFPPIRVVSSYDFTLYIDEIPDHANVSKLTDDHVLRIKRPALTPCPSPPAELNGWLKKGWDLPTAVPAHVEHIINSTGVQELFDVDARRLYAWNRWTQSRSQWAPQAAIDLSVERHYQKLYEQYSVLERDAEQFELIIGDGFVKWALPTGVVDHPLLLHSVDLTFNPQETEFTICLTARPVELYTAPISSDGISRVLSKAREQVATSPEIHPLDTETTSPFLRGLAASLDNQGEFVESPPATALDHPQIYRRLVVFRRSRSTGMLQAIRQALDDLETRETDEVGAEPMPELPEGLLRFVGIDTRPEERSSADSDGTGPADEDENTYFTKPGNREQHQIVRKLNRSGCVLVQGPPGTGKTHTIANLIGHLLANGKSVLVTSHTTKALTVVIDKVAEPLQPFCVSVLDSDIKNRERLEQSVQSIAEHVAEGADAYRTRAAQLTAVRGNLFSQVRELKRRLHAALASEYEPIGYRGNAILPIEAAREVHRGRDQHGWIPGAVAENDYLPLSLDELAELYDTNESLSPGEETNCPEEVPDITALPVPDRFTELVNRYGRLSSGTGEFPHSLVIGPTADDIQVVEHAVRLTHQLVAFFASRDCAWRTRIVEVSATDGKTWANLADEAAALTQRVAEVEDGLLRVGPVWSAGTEPREAIRVCLEIEQHLASGRSLNKVFLFTKPAWKRIVESLAVADGPPASRHHFEAARLSLELQRQRQEFTRVWNGRMSQIDGPAIPPSAERPETIASQHVADIRSCVSWYSTEWATALAVIERAGISVSKAQRQTQPGGNIEQLVVTLSCVILPALEQLAHRIRLREVTDELDAATHNIAAILTKVPELPLIQQLGAAALNRNADVYRALYADVVAVFGKANIVCRRRQLLRKLSASCPTWADEVRLRRGIHGGQQLPGDPNEAWRWKTLDCELTRRSMVSVQDLITSLGAAQEQAQEITTRLVEAMSWGHLASRTDMLTRMALAGYVGILRRIGRGTGKRAPRLVREAQHAMAESQGSVPVWVMPLSRIVDSFNIAKSRFDVVIIDESSQLDLMGLIAMYMAKQVIIVGDDKQVEPLDVGAKIEDTQSLIDEYLEGIPRCQLWDGRQSVYSLAEGPFEPIRLRQHFRCVPDIIRFSNHLSYKGSILPLREDAAVETRPFVVPYYVPGSVEQSRINHNEADSLIALLKACTEQPEYAGKSFGVIHLVGEDNSPQNEYVRRLARKHFSEVELDRMRLRCGNSAQFQGDERDVVFLSVFDTPQSGPLTLRSTDMHQKRYNVAASRARDQMWVLYSVNPETDLKAEDIRLRLIQHALNPRSDDARQAELTERTESDFERRLLARLIASGYNDIQPQYWVGAYRLDFAFRQGKLRVAIECDGEKYHTPETADDDLARQTTLERLGWKFVRIRGSEFYRDEDETVRRVVTTLEALGVSQSTGIFSPPEAQESDLLDRVKARAAELLALWRSAETNGETSAWPEEPPFRSDPTAERQTQSTESTANAVADPAPIAHRRTADSPRLACLEQYQQYHGSDLPDPKVTPVQLLTAKLAEIVEIEGPATVHTILDRYRVAAGFGKLRGPTKEALEAALRIAITSRRVVCLSTNADDWTGNVIALPSSPRVRLRERGPRDLSNVPVDEIAALVKHLELAGEAEEIVFAKVLEAYDLVRKTDAAKDRIRSAMAIASQVTRADAQESNTSANDQASPDEQQPQPTIPLLDKVSEEDNRLQRTLKFASRDTQAEAEHSNASANRLLSPDGQQQQPASPLRDKVGEVYRLRVYNKLDEIVLRAGIAVGRERIGDTTMWTIQPEGETNVQKFSCPPMVVKRLKGT